MSRGAQRRSDSDRFFGRGVLGFYVCCTLFGLATSVASIAWVLFPDEPGVTAVAIAAAIITVLSGLGSWYYLAVSRRER